MLRKEILTTQPITSAQRTPQKDIASIATVLVTSEDPDHPIDHVFDGQRGPGASRWIAAQPGEQTLILAFDAPQMIRKVLVEIEEPTIAAHKRWMSRSPTTEDKPGTRASGIHLQPARHEP